MENRKPRYCMRCGTELREGVPFCHKCGAPAVTSVGKQAAHTHSVRQRVIPVVLAVLVAIAFGSVVLLRAPFNAARQEPNQEQHIEPNTEPTKSNQTVPDELYTPSPESVSETDEGLLYINDTILIFFTPGSSEEKRFKIVDSVGGEIVGSTASLDEWQVRVTAGDEQTLMELCDHLEDDPAVVIATMDIISQSQASIPNDPWSDWKGAGPASWNVDNPDGYNWGFEAVDAPGAWEHMGEIKPVPLGMLDTGVVDNHEDLEGSVVNLKSPIGTGSNQPEIQFWNKDAWHMGDHATHVAGIMAAHGDNSLGIAGVSFGSTIYSVDVLNYSLLKFGVDATDKPADSEYSYTATTSQMIDSFDSLVRKGAKVINLSMGSSMFLKRNEHWSDWQLRNQGCAYSYGMHRLLEEGYDFVVVQAAGNGDMSRYGTDARQSLMFAAITKDNCYTPNPENISADDIVGRVIIVGNCGMDNGAYYQDKGSNGGRQVSVCAPGVGIWSCYEDSYKKLSGTSMAAPFVTGICGLVWGANPDLTGAQVKEIVCDTNNCGQIVPDNLDSPNATGDFPLVNARKAVEAALAIRTSDETNPFRNILLGVFSFAHFPNTTLIVPGQYKGEEIAYYSYAIADFDNDGAAELFIHKCEYNALTGENHGDTFTFYEADSGEAVLSYEVSDFVNIDNEFDTFNPSLQFHSSGTLTISTSEGNLAVLGVNKETSEQLGLSGYAAMRWFIPSEGGYSTYTSSDLGASEPEYISYATYEERYGWATGSDNLMDVELRDFYEEFYKYEWNNW